MDLIKVKHDVLGFVLINSGDFDPAIHTLLEAVPEAPEPPQETPPEMPPELPPDATDGDTEPPAKKTRKAAS